MTLANKPILGTTAAAAMLVASLAACTSAAPKAAPTPPASTPSATSSASPTPTAPPTAKPVSLDPCALVTQQDASALTGVSFGPGKLETDPGGAKRCVYGANTHNVLEVILAQAASVDQAKAYAAELRSQLEADLTTKVSISALSGVGDDAEQISGSLASIGVRVAGIYVRKGAIGFALVDETNGTPPTVAAMIAQAQAVMGELP